MFLLADGRPLTLGAVGKMLGRARSALGFPIHAHKFRHTFATMYVENGGDIERLRKILGHSTYAMILRYVHLNKRDLSLDFERAASPSSARSHESPWSGGMKAWERIWEGVEEGPVRA